MKHEEVVAALKVIAETGIPAGIGPDDLQSLKQFNLIDIEKAKDNKNQVFTLTKKGRVMLKANSKPE